MIIKKSSKKNKPQTNKNMQEDGNIIASDTVDEENFQEDSELETTDINYATETTQTEETQTIDLFDIENIDFEERQERRRGSRRRGYRRIDDRNLVSRAQEESENIKRSAYEEGYQQGLNKAEQDITEFRNLFSNFMNANKEVFEYIAPDILEISVDIAKKIIKKELSMDPQLIINTIVEVLKTISKNEPKVTIKVQPQAAQFVKDSIPDMAYQYGIDSKINVVADPSIEDGGCVFQTNNGIVDASINTQLEIIRKALEG